MSDLTNYDGRLEAMAAYTEVMYVNIAKVNNAYYDAVEDAYSKTLPNSYADLLSIKKIGGRTIVMNQLVNTGDTSVATISGHKYFTYISGTASIITSDGSAVSVVDDTEDMVIDMTLMFGPGNEPATTADFEAILPSLYEYDPGFLLSAKVTEVVSKDGTDATIGTITIPAEIQALEGYGWSAGTAYNYIDFDRKVFVKCVDRVDLGTLNWTTLSTPENSIFRIYSEWLSPKPKHPANNSTNANILTSDYIVKDYTAISASDNLRMAMGASGTDRLVLINKAYTDITEFTNSIKGKYLFYEIATPVETDISQYLTDDVITKVEKGGTLTFANQHGDDYRIPVPVQMEYIGV